MLVHRGRFRVEDRNVSTSVPLAVPLRGRPSAAEPEAALGTLPPRPYAVEFSSRERWHPNPSDIWIYELDHDLRNRLTTDAASDLNPIWSPDGSKVIFNSTREGVSGLYQKPSNGATAERLLLAAEAGTTSCRRIGRETVSGLSCRRPQRPRLRYGIFGSCLYQATESHFHTWSHPLTKPTRPFPRTAGGWRTLRTSRGPIKSSFALLRIHRLPSGRSRRTEACDLDGELTAGSCTTRTRAPGLLPCPSRRMSDSRLERPHRSFRRR